MFVHGAIVSFAAKLVSQRHSVRRFFAHLCRHQRPRTVPHQFELSEALWVDGRGVPCEVLRCISKPCPPDRVVVWAPWVGGPSWLMRIIASKSAAIHASRFLWVEVDLHPRACFSEVTFHSVDRLVRVRRDLCRVPGIPRRMVSGAGGAPRVKGFSRSCLVYWQCIRCIWLWWLRRPWFAVWFDFPADSTSSGEFPSPQLLRIAPRRETFRHHNC